MDCYEILNMRIVACLSNEGDFFRHTIGGHHKPSWLHDSNDGSWKTSPRACVKNSLKLSSRVSSQWLNQGHAVEHMAN